MHLNQRTLLKGLRLKGLGGKVIFRYNFILFRLLNDCKCEDSNDGAFVVCFLLFLNTEMVATEYSCMLRAQH